MRGQRGDLAVLVTAVVEVVDAAAAHLGQRLATMGSCVGRPTAHQPGTDLGVSNASRDCRLLHCVAEAGDILAQLAHDQEAAIAHQAAEFRVAVDSLVAFAIGCVGVTKQHLAQVNLV